MIRINLLPVREARRRADLQQQGFLLVALLAVTLIGTGWMHFAMRSKVSAAMEDERIKADFLQYLCYFRFKFVSIFGLMDSKPFFNYFCDGHARA